MRAGRSLLRFWPHVLVVAFLHIGYHRAQFLAPERERLYQTFLSHPVSASLANPVAALRLHHVRDGDEYLYLAWADLMLGKPADLDFLREESDAAIPLLPFHAFNGPLLPYRDFVFQYPPLALLPIVLPALITTDRIRYPYAFGTLAGLAALVTAIAGWRIHRRWGGSESRYLWISAGALFLVGVTLETRLDVFAAALVAVALWAAVTGRWTLAGALLGAGTALKIYPALLFPAFVAPLLVQRRLRETLQSLLALLAAVTVPCVAAVLVSWTGFLHALQLQSGRGLQVESVAATVLAWLDVFGGSMPHTVRLFGARDLAGSFTAQTAWLCTLAVPVMALLPLWKARKKSLLFDGVAMALAGIWIASPVLSPQYLVWGLPVFLFVTKRAARWLYLLALGVTRVEYPACYPIIAHLSLPGLCILTVRNGLLLATWMVLLRSRGALPRRGILVPAVIVASLLLLPVSPARADSAREPYGASFSFGLPAQFLSGMRYANSRQATFALFREWQPGPVLLPESVLESFLLELRLTRIWGANIPLEPDEVSSERAAQFRAEGRPLTGNWSDWQIGFIPCYRVSLPLSRETRPYVEFGAGLSVLAHPLIDNGTSWNFSLLAGLGVEKEIGNFPFHIALRAEHFSNFAGLWSQFGFTKANIGVEAVVLSVGLRGLNSR